MRGRCEDCEKPLRAHEFDLCDPCQEAEIEAEWEEALANGDVFPFDEPAESEPEWL